MKKPPLGLAALVLVLGFATPALVRAEGKDASSGPLCIGFVGPGSVSSISTLHLGGSYETPRRKRLSAGFELGYIGAMRSLGNGLGTLSINGFYHFPGSRTAQPFVTGGYTAAFRDGSVNLANLGTGVDYWIKPGVGTRIEVRDMFGNEYDHMWAVRFGVVFRLGGGR